MRKKLLDGSSVPVPPPAPENETITKGRKPPGKTDPRKGRGIKMDTDTAVSPCANMGPLVMRRVPVAMVKPAPYNPRKDLTPADPEYQKIKHSIETYGLVEPLVWNERTGNLVGGHQRLKILVKEFGVTEVEVSVINKSLAQEQALNIGLNKLGGDWEQTALAELLAGLQNSDEVDVAVTGFDESDIDVLIAGQSENAETPKAETGEVEAKAERCAVLIERNSEAHRRRVFGACKKQGYSCVEALVGGGYWREAE